MPPSQRSQTYGWPVVGLLLGADEEHFAALGDDSLEEFRRRLNLRRRFHEVDDVDAVPGFKDEFPHLRVPPARLVSKMHTRVQQFFYITHTLVFQLLPAESFVQPSRGKTGFSSLWLMPPRAAKPKVEF